MVNYVWGVAVYCIPSFREPQFKFPVGALRHIVLIEPNNFIMFFHGSLCLFFRNRKRLLPCPPVWEYLDHIAQGSPSSASGKRLEFALPQRPQPQWTMELWTGYHSVWLPFLLYKTFLSFPMAISLPFCKSFQSSPCQENSLKQACRKMLLEELSRWSGDLGQILAGCIILLGVLQSTRDS